MKNGVVVNMGNMYRLASPDVGPGVKDLISDRVDVVEELTRSECVRSNCIFEASSNIDSHSLEQNFLLL